MDGSYSHRKLKNQRNLDESNLQYCKLGKLYLTPIVRRPLLHIIHTHYIEQNNVVPAGRAFIKSIITLSSTRADDFPSHALARNRRPVLFFLFALFHDITFRGLLGQVPDTAGPRYQEEGTLGRLSRATVAAAGSKLPASGPHYITLLLC